MSAADTLTWDIAAVDGGARRPSLDDVGGAVLEDDPDYPPPDDGTMPSAAMLNQVQAQAQAVGKVAAAAIITVTFSGSTPSVSAVLAPGTSVTTGSFTVTDNGTGDTTLSWTSGVLPAQTCEPEATMNGSTPGMVAASKPTATSVRVVTWNAAGSAADRPFTVRVN